MDNTSYYPASIINCRDCNGNSSLHLSVQNDDEKTVRFLLKLGCNVNTENSMGETPLFLANFNNPGIVKILLSAGANVNHENKKGQNPLYLAVVAQNLDSVNAILNSSSNFTHSYDECPSAYKSALKHAVRTELIDIARELLRKIATAHLCCFS